ncbi:MAG: WecB/TagA/CpsF family glycosyltransferase [SAR324 cluster bacterium]|nr:WecB/TagA/CpsF family glycosyltransferase [SAR324 cluster bacterium]
MDNKIDFMGLHYDNVDLDEAVAKMEQYIQEGTPHIVCSTAAELVVRAQTNQLLKDTYDKADLLTLDSKVNQWSAALLGYKAKSPVGTAKLILHFLEKTKHKNYKYFILGAKQEVLEQAVKNMAQQYPNIKIVGSHHGYFKEQDEERIFEQIRQAKPDVLMVAMTSPLKERILMQNHSKIGVPVAIGVGGGVDIIAGFVTLAPVWISDLGLEWLYRLIQEPKRFWPRYRETYPTYIKMVMKKCVEQRITHK